MATPTTTEVAILEALVPVVEALTPAQRTDAAFERHATEDVNPPTFREWAEKNSQTSLRWFDITADEFEPEQYSNGDIVRRGIDLEIVVCYPHVWGAYDDYASDYTKRHNALVAMLQADMTQIVNAIGPNGTSNYPSGAIPMAFATVAPEIGVGVTFGVATWPTEYFADMSP